MDYEACPNCEREATSAISSNFFPVYRCSECDTVFCNKCRDQGCSSSEGHDGSEVGKVYAG